MLFLMRRAIVVGCILLGYTPSLHAQEFRIGITHWPPFRLYAAQEVQGIDVDIWDEIGRRLNLDITYVKCPWARCLAGMKDGSLDGLVSLAYRDDRAEYIHYTAPPVYKLTTVFYVQKGESHILQKYEDLYDLNVGFVNKSAYFDPFNDDTKIRKHGVVAEIQLIKMLAQNRLDTFIGTDPQVAYQIKETGFKGALEKAEYYPGNELPLFLGVSKSSAHAKKIDQINTTIEAILDEGLIDTFYEKWVSN